MQRDLLIITTGKAAMVAAMRAQDAGWNVAVIDERPFGGTCALSGSVPKKMLITGTEMVDGFRRMRGKSLKGQAGLIMSIVVPKLPPRVCYATTYINDRYGGLSSCDRSLLAFQRV